MTTQKESILLIYFSLLIMNKYFNVVVAFEFEKESKIQNVAILFISHNSHHILLHIVSHLSVLSVQDKLFQLIKPLKRRK